MVELYPKFIIEKNGFGTYLIIGKVVFHRELADVKENVLGGGFFNIKEGVMTFSGRSEDFGEADIEDIKEAIKSDNVYSNKYFIRSIANKFKFKYDNGTEIIEL